MKRRLIRKPNKKQAEMYRATAKYICFGGARGGGKSEGVRGKDKLLCVEYPGIRTLIVRRSYPELINNHIRTMRQELLGIADYNDKEKILKWKNGSITQFTYCDNDKDLDRLQGVEFDVIFIDEATQFTEYQLKVIAACCRGVNNFPKRVYYTCNPGGPGHAYIKRVFIDRRYIEGENPEDYVFIQSLVTDNDALMRENPDYIQQLKALPPKLRKAWLEGRWDIFEGQFFEDFRTEPDIELCEKLGITPEDAKAQHKCVHVIDPFNIPRDWTIYRSFDWGYSKPFSCAWWAVDYDGVLYRILEYYGCTDEPNTGVKLPPKSVFEEISRIEHEHPWLKDKTIYGVADPAIWDAQKGESIAETAEKFGIFFEKGDHKRIPGWMQLHYRFQFDENGYPMMYIFSTCQAFIRTIPLLMYDEHKVEDLDTTGEDHAADEARYLCMARPIEPVKAIVPSKYKQSMLYQALQIPEEDLGKPIRRSRIQRL